ncbi:hypothetical protein, partial [Escherichia coli]|uniref:hypothetical protein n=1 Tax=Escherichia coli TaxID=562 RepID=UPI0039E1A8B6
QGPRDFDVAGGGHDGFPPGWLGRIIRPDAVIIGSKPIFDKPDFIAILFRKTIRMRHHEATAAQCPPRL